MGLMLLSSWLAPPAAAALVTFSFTGEIVIVNTGGQNGVPLIGGISGINIGDPFSVTFAYESADSGLDQNANPNLGVYFLSPTSTVTLSLNIDGNQFRTQVGSISQVATYNNLPTTLSASSDLLEIFQVAPVLPAGWTATPPNSSSSRLLLADSRGTALPNDLLPTVFNPSAWEQGVVTLAFNQTVVTPGLGGVFNDVYIEGRITAVPEPSLGGGLVALVGCVGMFRRRLVHKKTAGG